MLLNNTILHIYNIYNLIVSTLFIYPLIFISIIFSFLNIYYNSSYYITDKLSFIHFASKGVKNVLDATLKYAPLITANAVVTNTINNIRNSNKPNKDGSNKDGSNNSDNRESNNSDKPASSPHSYVSTSNYSENSFFFATVLSFLNINIPENSPPFLELSFTVFTISIVVLFCFMNTIFYLTALLLVSKYNIESYFADYPRLVKFIKYYSKATYLYIIIEALACFIALLVLTLGSLVLILTILK